MAGEARCRVQFAVDLVLVKVIPPMRHGPLRCVLVLVRRLELFLVRMAVGAEGRRVTEVTGHTLLGRVEAMPLDEVRVMVENGPPVGVAGAADRHALDLHGMLLRHALVRGAGNEHYKGKYPDEDENEPTA